MTIILYDYCELEERTSKYFKVWKALHISLYALVALFGVMSYSSLEGVLQLYDGKCVLYPRKLEFYDVEVPCFTEAVYQNESAHHTSQIAQNTTFAQKINETAPLGQNTSANETSDFNKTTTRNKRETSSRTEDEIRNVTLFEGCVGNETSWLRPALDTRRTLFGDESDCEWALYTPLVSTVFAAVWITLFTMCPGGGRVRAGLQQPWRILAPALAFAAVLAVVTGHSFSRTSGGLHAFCAAFSNLTNATTCGPVSLYTEGAWNVSVGVGGRAAVARAAGAGVWASWACAGALLLARCLAAPDFAVRRTGVLLKDPRQKITSRLKKSPKKQNVHFARASHRDDISLHSEPTLTSDLVTASVDRHDDSAPSSVFDTPERGQDRQGPMLEMTSLPHIDERTTPDQYK